MPRPRERLPKTCFSWRNYSTSRQIKELTGKHINMKRAPHVKFHVTPHFYSNTVLNITLSSGVWLYRVCVSAQTRHFKNGF